MAWPITLNCSLILALSSLSVAFHVLSPARYSLCVSFPLRSIHSVRKLTSVTLKEHNLKLPEGLLILSRNFQSMRLHIHPHNTYDADSLRELLERKFLVDKVCEISDTVIVATGN